METTTAFSTYSNVPFPNLEEVPLIKQSDKAKILCLPAVKVGEEWKPKEWEHGELVPLFWGESKTIELYEALIKNYNIQSICDLSCHWALAAAALRSSIQYYGIAMSSAQAEWTMNIADRYAARCICQSDHLCTTRASLHFWWTISPTQSKTPNTLRGTLRLHHREAHVMNEYVVVHF